MADYIFGKLCLYDVFKYIQTFWLTAVAILGAVVGANEALWSVLCTRIF